VLQDEKAEMAITTDVIDFLASQSFFLKFLFTNRKRELMFVLYRGRNLARLGVGYALLSSFEEIDQFLGLYGSGSFITLELFPAQSSEREKF
jgi:hypothetical protein